MADTTTNYGLPYPEATDDPEVWTDVQALAEAVDTTIKERTDDVYDAMLPGQASDGTNSSVDITSTTPNNGGSPLGVSFVAPPSGRVFVYASGALQVVSGQVAMGPQVRAGSTIGSGSVVYDPSADPGCKFGSSVAQTLNGYCGALVTGLTPGAAYNVCNTVFALTSGTARYFGRQAGVLPQH